MAKMLVRADDLGYRDLDRPYPAGSSIPVFQDRVKVGKIRISPGNDRFMKCSVSELSGEKYWRIPHFDEFREFIKSDIADLHNTSVGGAGGICAGLFLDSFKEEKPFIHLDVAGMTFTQKKRDGYPKGGTGYGVKTVYEYIKG